MTSNFDWSQFEPVEDEQESNQGIDWSQFETTQPSAYKDVIGEEISKNAPVDFDDGNEFERMYEKGAAEATRGLLSGASFGFSENIPTLKPEEGKGTDVAKFTGSLLPIHYLSKIFKPLEILANKSPMASKALSGLAGIVGAGLTGSSVNALESAFKGEIPDAEEVAKHGATWSAIDAAFGALGKLGTFGKAIINAAKKAGIPKYQALNQVTEGLEKAGLNLSTPEKAFDKAMEILEKPIEKGAKELKIPEKKPSSIEKLYQENLQNPKVSSSDILNKKINPETFKSSIEDVAEKAESYNLNELDTEALVKDIETLPSHAEIERIAPRAESELALGKGIKEDLEKQFEAAKETYEPLYYEVEAGAKDIEHSPENTINLVNKATSEINSLSTKPEGYKKVLDTLEDVLSDLGVYKLKTSKNFKFPPVKVKVKLPQIMELGRRLNKIIDYDLVGPSIKDKLKPIARAVKQEVREALSKKSPELSKKFSEAESNYGKSAERFSKDNIYKIRSEDNPEKIIAGFTQPSKLQSLKDTVSPQQFEQIEREILENAKSLPHAKVNDLSRELRGILSEDAQSALKSLEKDKLPLGKVARERNLRQGIADDVAYSVSTGQRPEKTLKLWKTEKGQNLINQALKDTPNKKEILDYLKTQSFYDFAASTVDNTGKINFKKFKEFLADPAFRNNIETIGGKEAVSFFKNLELLSNKLDKNLNLIERLPKPSKAERGKTLLERSANIQEPKSYRIAQEKLLPSPKGKEQRLIASERGEAEKVSKEKGQDILKRIRESEVPEAAAMERFYEKLGLPGKAVLSYLGYLQLGIPKASVVLTGAKLMHMLTKNVKTRNAFIKAVNSSSKHPVEALAMLDYLAEEASSSE